MVCGIYKIENNINHNIYIGQSKNIKDRWRSHKSNAFNQNSKDYNMVIYQAIRKYGIDAFSFEVLEECSQELLNEKEKYWIQYYDSYNSGYNSTPGGDDACIHPGKIIELYDLMGKYVTEYPSATEAAQSLGISRNTIYGILQGQRLSTKGYQFKYKNDSKIIQPYMNKQGGKKPVAQYDKQNNIISVFESAAEAARQLSLDASTITKVCKGKLKTHGGYIWRYE